MEPWLWVLGRDPGLSLPNHLLPGPTIIGEQTSTT